MNRNRYQSGEEPRKGDLVERVDIEGGDYGKKFDERNPLGSQRRVLEIITRLLQIDPECEGGLYPKRFKLIERADPGCPYKIGDTLSHAGSKRTGVVQEFKRNVHPLTKEVWYSAWVRRPNSDRLKYWDLRRCTLVGHTPTTWYSKGNDYGNILNWTAIKPSDRSNHWVVHPGQQINFPNDGISVHADHGIRNTVHTLATPAELPTDGFHQYPRRWESKKQPRYWEQLTPNGEILYHEETGEVFPAEEYETVEWLSKYRNEITNHHATQPEQSAFVGIRTDTGEAVRASDLKQEPATFTECESCRAKPGSPLLCDGCLYRRTLQSFRDQLDTVTRERDEATQAADKLQTQLNELRDTHAKLIEQARHVERKQRERIKAEENKVTFLLRRYDELKKRVKGLLNDA